MISRVAEHCFWMSRYLERAENTARILEVNQTLLLDFDVPTEQQWKPLLIISGIHDLPGDDAEAVQHYMTWEEKNASSIVSSLASARENARVMREVISADMWERLNYYHLWLSSPAAQNLYNRDRAEFYNQIKRINQLFHGLTDGTMSHGEPWEFIQLGKFLERASLTARILDVKYHILLPTPQHLGTPVDNAHWMAILNSCSAYEPYHKQRSLAEPETSVPDFLIYDPHFPRSVRHCLIECQEAAHAISGRQLSRPGNDVEHQLQDLVGWLYLVQIEDFIRAGLHEGLTSVVDRIHDIGDAIHRTYFEVDKHMAMPARQMSEQTAAIEQPVS
ncbi:MAG: alpha-E domain-containing protein [Planctomycetes bacterium]|nr:alpha-E domain-containing protein [Planctomycetota bacterium]